MTGPGSDPPEERLPCGRRREDLLAQVSDGRGAHRDAHQQTCVHCRATLGEYERLWAPVRELALETVHPPTAFLENALRRIRGAVEQSEYGVLDSPGGRTRIAARVVVVAARQTAQSVPGVRVALSKHLDGRDGSAVDRPPTGAPEVSAGVAGGSTAIEIVVAADYGTDLVRLGERVRREVTARVRALTDLEPVFVTVIIDDVLD